MATRSTISFKMDDGKILSAYCHYDGYLSYNGRVLLEHYSDADKVYELVSNGDMRALGEELEDIEYYNDGNSDARIYLKSQLVGMQEFNYLFEDGEWYYNSRGKNWTLLKSVNFED